MTPDPDEFHAYIERFAGVLTDTGFPRMPARVFVALMTADSGRLTAAELAETLRISPAAVSGAVRYLSQLQLVGRERDPGSRRDRYRVFDEVWREAMLQRDFVLSRWQSALTEGIRLLGEDSPASSRLDESLQFFTFLRREMPALLERYYREREEALALEGARPAQQPAQSAQAAQPSQPGRTSPDS
ncbi:GbsR/MarR family transcriptional regulator [Streptacidiphilus anmyonensis]|uniref:GbsR/MarR family transcriptional regulator n=1 Tax=Streptacidiphilus anmyonensis TaxID=405782 RepID=UPI0007C87CC3|nr:helix-turn-helix domain-containing protein [Streptacidiphilus anmyonensis]